MLPLYTGSTGTKRTWEGYLEYLSKGKDNDYLTLYATAYACKLQIVVLTSVLDEAYTVAINSSISRKIEIAHWHKMNYCAIASTKENNSLQPSDGSNVKVLCSKIGSSSLKNYKVIPNLGIEFEFSEEIKPPWSVQNLSNGDRLLSLEIPGSEIPKIIVNKENTRLMEIKGTKLPLQRVIQSTRKTGPWVFKFEIPEGFRFEDNVGYADGICDVLLKKGNAESIEIVAQNRRIGQE